MLIPFDIETLPCNDAAVIAEIHAGIKPPGNLKKAETIEQWWKDEGEKAKQEAVAKTSFDGLYGRIACICAAVNDEEPIEFDHPDEKKLLTHFNDWLYETLDVALYDRSISNTATFIGHNIVGFDLPFLKHRSIINSVRPHPILLKAMNAKPWDGIVADTMLMWSQDREKRASMDKLCRALEIPGKGDFDGSMVAETWPIDPLKVVDYCKQDVIRARQIYQRMTFSC